MRGSVVVRRALGRRARVQQLPRARDAVRGILREQLVQDRRARSAGADDEHRRVDALVEDLRDARASVACTSSRLTSARTISLRAMIRPSRWRSASSSSARTKMPNGPRRQRVVAEVVETGRGARRVEQRLLVERDERGRRSELTPERVELGRPTADAACGDHDHASDVARASTAARRRASCSRRSLGVDDGMRRRKVLAQRRRAARRSPRAPGASACRSSGTRASPRADPRCRSSWERRDRRPRRRAGCARRRRRTPAPCSGSSAGSRSRRSRAGSGGARVQPQ